MKNFIKKAIQMLPKLNSEQIEHLIDKLAEENEMLSVVLDSIEEGIIVTNLEHKIQLLNKTARRSLPMRRETDEQVFWTVIKDHDIAEYLDIHMHNGDKILDEEFYVQKGKVVAVLSFSVYPLVRNKRILGNIIMLRDITEQKKSDAKYRRAENLASLTTLAASVAHEIKNPLASMGIYLQLMQKELDRENCIGRESATEYLDIIQEEIERLNGIVVDFLFAVRPMDTRMKAEDLNMMIHEVLEFTKYELEQSDIEYKFEPAKQLPKIEMDKKYMKQVLLNIIKNAIAAMPNGGSLHVTTYIQGGMVNIDIQDNGIGISKDDMSKIFEPYYTTKDFGSGLGLTVVYKIVREHGGEVSLNSQEGEGTTFTVSLPLPHGERTLIDWEGSA